MALKVVKFVVTHCVVPDDELIQQINNIRNIFAVDEIIEAIDKRGAFQEQKDGTIICDAVVLRKGKEKEIKKEIKKLNDQISDVKMFVQEIKDTWWEKWGLVTTIGVGAASGIISSVISAIILTK